MTIHVHGIILAGGKSSRMGQDKALLNIHNQPMVAYIANQLSGVCSSVTVVASCEAVLRYRQVLDCSVRFVEDMYPHQGPLSGIHAGLRTLQGNEDVAWVMACDMPRFSQSLFEKMKAQFLALRNDIIMCPGQYFHAMYHPRVAIQAEIALFNHQLKMSEFLVKLAVTYVVPEPHELQAFVNINTPEDYRTYELLLHSRENNNPI
jgi:molybdopterin-guanine dinucleotide biosynthesis protein A